MLKYKLPRSDELYVLMYTDEIEAYGRALVPHFLGVYPLDKMPSHICIPSRLIVNTDTHNLKGEHWLAVSYEHSGIIYAFDPLGFYYPKLLVERLHRLPHRRIIYNRKAYQMPWENTCGQHCLNFLYKQSKENATLVNHHHEFA